MNPQEKKVIEGSTSKNPVAAATSKAPETAAITSKAPGKDTTTSKKERPNKETKEVKKVKSQKSKSKGEEQVVPVVTIAKKDTQGSTTQNIIQTALDDRKEERKTSYRKSYKGALQTGNAQPQPILPSTQKLPTPKNANQNVQEDSATNEKITPLPPNLINKLNKAFKRQEDFQDNIPPMFNGEDYLSYNVDFLIWKVREKIDALIDFDDFCHELIKTIVLTIPRHLAHLFKGAHFNTGKGGKGKEFCTYRVVLRKRFKDPDELQELHDFLKQGVAIEIYGEEIVVPAVSAPANSLYNLKIIRLSQFDSQMTCQDFADWFFENILKQLPGYQKSTHKDTFLMWDPFVRARKYMVPDPSVLYLIVENVDEDADCLSERKQKQAKLKEGSLLTISQNSFAMNRLLVNLYQDMLKWPYDFENELDMDTIDEEDDNEVDEEENEEEEAEEEAENDTKSDKNSQTGDKSMEDEQMSPPLPPPPNVQNVALLPNMNTKYADICKKQIAEPKKEYWGDLMDQLTDEERRDIEKLVNTQAPKQLNRKTKKFLEVNSKPNKKSSASSIYDNYGDKMVFKNKTQFKRKSLLNLSHSSASKNSIT